MDAVFVHDAAALAAALAPHLFDWHPGGVYVVTDGPAKGRTIRDEGEWARWGRAGGQGVGWWGGRPQGAAAHPPPTCLAARQAPAPPHPPLLRHHRPCCSPPPGSLPACPCLPLGARPQEVGGRKRVAGAAAYPRGAGRARRRRRRLGARPHVPLSGGAAESCGTGDSHTVPAAAAARRPALARSPSGGRRPQPIPCLAWP